MSELGALDPVPDSVTLESGLVVEMERLKTRQFFKLLRIVTRGALPQLGSMNLFGGSEEDFITNFLALVLAAVPEAEDETIDFIRSMGKPAALVTGRRVSKQDEQHNADLWAAFDEQLDNPELDDLVTIIEVIVKREAGDIQALGKRLAGMLKLAEKTGQIPANAAASPSLPTASIDEYSEDSPAPSTSSAANTGGRTTRSSTSRSRGSASASRRSKNAVSTAAGNESNG